jgi:hypothetical protein
VQSALNVEVILEGNRNLISVVYFTSLQVYRYNKSNNLICFVYDVMTVTLIAICYKLQFLCAFCYIQPRVCIATADCICNLRVLLRQTFGKITIRFEQIKKHRYKRPTKARLHQ